MGAHSRPGLFKRVLSRDSEPGFLFSAETAGALFEVANDRSPSPKEMDMEVAEQTDELTGLAGRPDLLAQLRKAERSRALVLFDMDDFGGYNERYGQEAGDEAIRAIAHTLTACARDRGRVYRAGGDRFAVLLDTGDDDQPASAWANSALEALSPLPASGSLVILSSGQPSEGALRDAEITLVALKEAGGGMVGTYGPHVDRWARSRRHEVEALARQVEELRLENKRLSESMLIDPVTGLRNATAFDADHIQLEHRRRRSEDPYSVILAEVDNFDSYESGLGLESGLSALASVANTINRTVRGSDRSYRVGEAEFAVLLPGAQMREAVAAAERIRMRVEKLALPHPANPAGVVTVTLAAVAAGFRHETPKDVMVELQDVLQAGAAEGRNRVLWPL